MLMFINNRKLSQIQLNRGILRGSGTLGNYFDSNVYRNDLGCVNIMFHRAKCARTTEGTSAFSCVTSFDVR